jgi:hypothetical protein
MNINNFCFGGEYWEKGFCFFEFGVGSFTGLGGIAGGLREIREELRIPRFESFYKTTNKKRTPTKRQEYVFIKIYY